MRNDRRLFSVDTVTLPKVWSVTTGIAISDLPLPEGEVFGVATGVNNSGIIIGNHMDKQPFGSMVPSWMSTATWTLLPLAGR